MTEDAIFLHAVAQKMLDDETKHELQFDTRIITVYFSCEKIDSRYIFKAF